VSLTKQARADSGKEPELHQVTEWREVNSSVLPLPGNEHSVIMIQAASQIRLWIKRIVYLNEKEFHEES